MNNINFLLPTNLKARFKLKAVENGSTMTDELIAFIKQYVGDEEGTLSTMMKVRMIDELIVLMKKYVGDVNEVANNN